MSRKCSQASNLNSFFKSEWRQNEGDQQTVVKIQSVLKVVRIHQHAQFQAIPSCVVKEMPEHLTGRTTGRKVSWLVGHLGNGRSMGLSVGRTDGQTGGRKQGIADRQP